MRALRSLLLAFLLALGLLNGSMLHAVELSGGHEVTEATAWLHSDGDHDEVPPDADHNYPHHHNQCHGHDVAASAKGCAAPVAERIPATLKPAPMSAMAGRAPPAPLRPPIA